MYDDARAAYLTGTKALQDQIAGDFGGVEGFCDIRGMANYPCNDIGAQHFPKRNCKTGKCLQRRYCEFQEIGCDYFDAVRATKVGAMVSTNYSYYLHMQHYGRGMGRFDWLILDEAHELENQVLNFLDVRITWSAIRAVVDVTGIKEPRDHKTVAPWRAWAWATMEKLAEYIAITRQSQGATDTSDPVASALFEIAKIARAGNDWFIHGDVKELQFAPINLHGLVDRTLSGGMKRVIMSSATMTRDMAAMFGVGDNAVFIEAEHPCPRNNRRLGAMPAPFMTFRTWEKNKARWARVHDGIMERHVGEKGIIHTGSYKRMEALLSMSKYADSRLMPTSRGCNVGKVIREFKRAPAGTVLISPVVTTGYDFPGDECRFQIISKIPYPSTQSRVEKRRMTLHPRRGDRIAAQIITQTYGRAIRSADDYCKTYFADGMAVPFIKKNADLFPSWALTAYTAGGI